MARHWAGNNVYLDKKPLLQTIWCRAKEGVSLSLFGIRLCVKARRATPLATNRIALIKRIAVRTINGPAVDRAGQAPSLSDQSEHTDPSPVDGVAVVVGVGEGLGTALVTHLNSVGMKVAAVSRQQRNLAELRTHAGWPDDRVKLYAADATNELSLQNVMKCIALDLGEPNLVIYLVHSSASGPSLEIEPHALEDAWRANCLGAFITARNAAKSMVRRGKGTIIFAGATSGTIGRPGYLCLAVGKFALRALSQVMARVHVVHVIIDGGHFYFDKPHDEPGTDPLAAAKTILALHLQAKNAWTHELDLRPWHERFWEHC